MNKKLKVAILTIMMFLTVGCTKYVKDHNNNPVTTQTTGQTLTANILCKPTSDELYKIYQ